jgi:hypothetical protein
MQEQFTAREEEGKDGTLHGLDDTYRVAPMSLKIGVGAPRAATAMRVERAAMVCSDFERLWLTRVKLPDHSSAAAVREIAPVGSGGGCGAPRGHFPSASPSKDSSALILRSLSTPPSSPHAIAIVTRGSCKLIQQLAVLVSRSP